MGVVVAFDYGQFISTFPEFGGLSQTAAFTGSIASSLLSVSALASGSLPIGSVITGANGDVLPGTYISSINTVGSSYNVNYPQTVPSEQMSATIPQVPLLAATSIFNNQAIIYHRNDGGGPIDDPTLQSNLLNMVVAHLAFMQTPILNGQPASPLVGRISQASQGPVNVSVDFDAPPGTPQWWLQTKYGADYYAATAAFRTMRYIRGPRRNMNPWFGTLLR